MTVDIGALVTSIGGLGATLAGSIPSLKRVKKTDSRSRAAAAGAGRVQDAAVGASQQGFGASKGLSLRSGLRAASKAALASGGAMAGAAAADEAATQARTDARTAAISGLANAGAAGLAQVSQSLISPEEDGTGPAELQQLGDPNEEAAFQQAEDAGLGQGERQELLSDAPLVQDEETAGIIGDTQRLGEAERKDELVADLRDPVLESVAVKKGGFSPEIEIELEQKLQMKELMFQEAERQGITLESVSAKITRGLGLQPGQSSSDPFGQGLISPQFDATVERSGEE